MHFTELPQSEIKISDSPLLKVGAKGGFAASPLKAGGKALRAGPLKSGGLGACGAQGVQVAGHYEVTASTSSTL